MTNEQQRSPKSAEVSQNDNNINMERNTVVEVLSIDEVDQKVAPQAKKREKKPEVSSEKKEEFKEFNRQSSLNDSGRFTLE